MGNRASDWIFTNISTQSPFVPADGAADTIVFNSVNHTPFSNPDLIFSFEHGLDKIDFSGIDANPNVAGNQAFVFGTGAPTGVGPEARLVGDYVVLPARGYDTRCSRRFLQYCWNFDE